jgi:branched-subunit amino acid aminotransferase/4-amino-4-deoxychorismate lyase
LTTELPEFAVEVVASPARVDVHINTVGYVVFLREDGRWTANWDGEVHPDRASGEAALAEAQSRGYDDAILTASIRMPNAEDDLR